MMSVLKTAALAAVALPLVLSPAHAEPLVVEVQCLCKLGHKPDWYKGIVALTPESRDKMRGLIEAGSFGLWKTITLKGKGCNEATFPEGWKDKCGSTSISHKSADGKRTSTSVANEEFSGEVTIEVKANGGIPTAADTPGKEVTLDEKRWPDTPRFSVMGVDVNSPATKPARKGKK